MERNPKKAGGASGGKVGLTLVKEGTKEGKAYTAGHSQKVLSRSLGSP